MQIQLLGVDDNQKYSTAGLYAIVLFILFKLQLTIQSTTY